MTDKGHGYAGEAVVRTCRHGGWSEPAVARRCGQKLPSTRGGQECIIPRTQNGADPKRADTRRIDSKRRRYGLTFVLILKDMKEFLIKNRPKLIRRAMNSPVSGKF